MAEPSGGGRLITFEGIDGSGKSTQARALAAALRAAGVPVLATREPGGSAGAEEIRNLLLNGAPDRWSAESEILLFTAARRDHLERTIAPALTRGETVICDRFVDSTRVYQGAAAPRLRDLVDQLHRTMIAREADLTFVIDISPEVGLARAMARQGGEMRFESRGLDWQRRLREGFLKVAAEAPARIRLIAGDRPHAEVAAEIAALAGLAPGMATPPCPGNPLP
jgi:dTMP kinase